jgi:hypothetical protein
LVPGRWKQHKETTTLNREELLRATGYIVKQHKETTTFSQGGREGFEKEGLEEMINKIMRLGRVRGIGCIMATHRPQEETLRRVGMEKNAKILETAPEGLGIIKTHVYRVSEIMFRTYLPSHS